MQKLIAISLVCGALAACGSKKAPPAQEGPRAIDKPPPVWETPPPPMPEPVAPPPPAVELVAKPVSNDEAVAVVKTWLGAISAGDPAAAAAVMTADVRLHHFAYPGDDSACPDEIMTDAAPVAACLVAVMRDGAKGLTKGLKKAQVSTTVDPLLEPYIAKDFVALPGTPVFVDVEHESAGIQAGATVAVIGGPDGPRIAVAKATSELLGG